MRLVEHLELVVAIDDLGRALHECARRGLEQRLEVRLERREDEHRDGLHQRLDERSETWDLLDRLLDLLHNCEEMS